MNYLGAFIIAIGILTVVPIFATAKDLLSQPPIVKLYEVDRNNNVIGPYDQVDNERLETIVERLDHLRLECHAYYPVQWIYTGDGIPIMDISLSTTEKKSEGLNQYTASSFISSVNEYHTGKYQCRSTTVYNTASTSSNIYIYVPGQDLFTAPEGKTIQIPRNVSYFLIPCSVSHPRVQVSLQKLDRDVLTNPLTNSNNAIEFDPRKGFRVNLRQIENPEGIYICTARYNNRVRGVEYTISSKPPRYEPVSEKLEEFKQTPEETCRGESCKECTTHTDCRPMMNCYTDFKCRDPCTYSIRCGIGSLCRVIENRPECYCPRGFLGDATKECYNAARYIRDP